MRLLSTMLITDGVINPYKCDADTYGWQPTGLPFNDAYRCESASHVDLTLTSLSLGRS